MGDWAGNESPTVAPIRLIDPESANVWPLGLILLEGSGILTQIFSKFLEFHNRAMPSSLPDRRYGLSGQGLNSTQLTPLVPDFKTCLFSPVTRSQTRIEESLLAETRILLDGSAVISLISLSWPRKVWQR